MELVSMMSSQFRKNPSSRWNSRLISLVFLLTTLVSAQLRAQESIEEMSIDDMSGSFSVDLQESLDRYSTHPLNLRQLAQTYARHYGGHSAQDYLQHHGSTIDPSKQAALADLASLAELDQKSLRRILVAIAQHPAWTLDSLFEQGWFNARQRAVIRACCRCPAESPSAIDTSASSSLSARLRRSLDAGLGDSDSSSIVGHDSSAEASGLLIAWRNRWSLQAERPSGLSENASVYTRSSLNHRLSVDAERAQLCISSDKDPGEGDFADALCASLQYQIDSSTNCVLGDYRVMSGLGSLMAPGLMQSKSSASLGSLSRATLNMRAVRSPSTSTSFRGICVQKNFESNSQLADKSDRSSTSQWRSGSDGSDRESAKTKDNNYDADSARSNRTALQPDESSSAENALNTDAALSEDVEINSRWTLLCAYGSTYRDASIDSLSHEVLSLDLSALHRTETERAKQNSLLERSQMLCVEHESKQLRLGLSCLRLDYDHPFASGASSGIVGSQAVLLSLYGQCAVHDERAAYNLVGELARDAQSRYALQLGLHRSSGKSNWLLRLRSFSTDFHSPYASTLGSSSNAANERGIYSAWQQRYNNGLELRLYADLFRSLKPRYAMAFSSEGCEVGLEVRKRLNSASEAVVRYRESSQSDGYRGDDNVLKMLAKRSRTASLRLSTMLPDQVQINTQLLLSMLEVPGSGVERGSLLSCALRYSLNTQFSLRLSQQLYSSDSFATALYNAEEQAPGYWSAGASYGSGAHTLCSLHWQYTPNCSVFLAYQRSEKNNTNTLSSGFSELNSNHLSTLLLQCELSW